MPSSEDGSCWKHHCGGLWGWPGSPSASHLALPLPLLFFMCRVNWFTVGQPGDTKKITYANEVYTLQKLCKFLSTLLRKKKMTLAFGLNTTLKFMGHSSSLLPSPVISLGVSCMILVLLLTGGGSQVPPAWMGWGWWGVMSAAILFRE